MSEDTSTPSSSPSPPEHRAVRRTKSRARRVVTGEVVQIIPPPTASTPPIQPVQATFAPDPLAGAKYDAAAERLTQRLMQLEEMLNEHGCHVEAEVSFLVPFGKSTARPPLRWMRFDATRQWRFMVAAGNGLTPLANASLQARIEYAITIPVLIETVYAKMSANIQEIGRAASVIEAQLAKLGSKPAAPAATGLTKGEIAVAAGMVGLVAGAAVAIAAGSAAGGRKS